MFERRRHPGLFFFHGSIAWPMRSPVNASPIPSRASAHDSGSMWIATPSPWWTLITDFLPVSRRTRTKKPIKKERCAAPKPLDKKGPIQGRPEGCRTFFRQWVKAQRGRFGRRPRSRHHAPARYRRPRFGPPQATAARLPEWAEFADRHGPSAPSTADDVPATARLPVAQCGVGQGSRAIRH